MRTHQLRRRHEWHFKPQSEQGESVWKWLRPMIALHALPCTMLSLTRPCLARGTIIVTLTGIAEEEEKVYPIEQPPDEKAEEDIKP